MRISLGKRRTEHAESLENKRPTVEHVTPSDHSLTKGSGSEKIALRESIMTNKIYIVITLLDEDVGFSFSSIAIEPGKFLRNGLQVDLERIFLYYGEEIMAFHRMVYQCGSAHPFGSGSVRASEYGAEKGG